jgi:hypothetical protein
MGIYLDQKNILFKGGSMRNLHPDQSMVRIYLDSDKARGTDHKFMFLRRVREFSIDAHCEHHSQAGQSIVEVAARRDTIHQHVVPPIEEILPSTFLTMVAVCAFGTRQVSNQVIYGSKVSGSDNVKGLHQ